MNIYDLINTNLINCEKGLINSNLLGENIFKNYKLVEVIREI